jgi:hypothetical protein
MYQQQNSQQRQPRNPGSGRVWPAKQRNGPRAPAFTGEITLPDGHVMRVALWESFANRGTGEFNGFSIKLSEDTRQGNGYQAQAGHGQPQGYGQQPQNGYTAPQSGYSAPQGQNGQQGGYAPQQPPAQPHRAISRGHSSRNRRSAPIKTATRAMCRDLTTDAAPAPQAQVEARAGEGKRFPSHCKWVRGHRCCVPGLSRRADRGGARPLGTGGGMAVKPHDKWVISLCRDHHSEQHRVGETSFAFKHGVNLIAWPKSSPRGRPTGSNGWSNSMMLESHIHAARNRA